MKKGISLLVTIITIVVMIILSGTVVIGLIDNNPIEKAREAEFKAAFKNYEVEFITYTLNLASNPAKLKELNAVGDQIRIYIPSVKLDYIGLLEVVEGKLYANFEKIDESKKITWLNDIGFKILNIKSPVTYGLVSWLDGRDGSNVVDDTNIPEKPAITWKDKSGNGNDFKVYGIDNTEVSKFNGKSLICDGANDYLKNTTLKDFDYNKDYTFMFNVTLRETRTNSTLFEPMQIGMQQRHFPIRIQGGYFYLMGASHAERLNLNEFMQASVESKMIVIRKKGNKYTVKVGKNPEVSITKYKKNVKVERMILLNRESEVFNNFYRCNWHSLYIYDRALKDDEIEKNIAYESSILRGI